MDFIFVFRYRHQVLKLMRLCKIWILLPYRFTWANETWNTAHKTPLPKINYLWNVVNFVISNLQFIIVLREMYKVQIRNYYCWHGVNEYISSVRYIFLRKPTYKIQMHKHVCWNGETFQNNSQWARSVSTLLLTGRCNYCTWNPQMAHALPQYIVINKIYFEYNWYNLCGLLGVIT